MNRSPRSWFLTLAALLLLVPAGRSFALAVAKYSPALPADALCEVKIDDLRPTQFAIGMREVKMRAAKVRVMNPQELDQYLDDHLGTIVIGPGGAPFVVDKHHLARVLIEAKAGTVIRAKVLENDSRLSEPEFWAHMKEKKWVYLSDEHGKGPLDPADLPRTIAAMRDDPYRSLAWLVRTRGAITKVDDPPFAEFLWANFFRSRIPFQDTDAGFDEAVKEAMKLARSPDAKDLPGFKGEAAEKE